MIQLQLSLEDLQVARSFFILLNFINLKSLCDIVLVENIEMTPMDFHFFQVKLCIVCVARLQLMLNRFVLIILYGVFGVSYL